jgi:hypothetical protein
MMAEGLDDTLGHAAVNHKVLACDELTLNQGDNQVRDIFRLVFSMQQNAILNVARDLDRLPLLNPSPAMG